jgi:hypothetical protein
MYILYNDRDVNSTYAVPYYLVTVISILRSVWHSVSINEAGTTESRHLAGLITTSSLKHCEPLLQQI